MTEPLLRLHDLQKSFGGLHVCNRVNLELIPGEIHGLIGPNGAGKTTLLNLISGLLDSDSGTHSFRGQDITALSAQHRARLGMARSFQITSLFQEFTVAENVQLAVQATMGSSYRFWKPAHHDARVTGASEEILHTIGLSQRAQVKCSQLSHGEQRLLDIAMALAGKPALLLLDEPMAGLGPGSSQSLTRLIGELKGSVTMLLVEHDMKAVFSLADRITVLVEGAIAATGTPDEIRSNPVVQEAYLGQSC